MNKYLSVVLLSCATFFLVACEADKITYEGPDYIMFSDSLQTIAIQDSETYHEIPVVATTVCDYDRTFAVELIDKESNAIEGVHYDLASNTVTIKAGETEGAVKIRGHFDDFEDTDSIGISLRLVVSKDKVWSLYGDNTKVVLVKVCPFDIERFVGHAVLTSMFFTEYMPTTDLRLIETLRDPEEKNGIILKDFLYDGYDIKVRFNTDDPLEPKLEMDPQIVALASEPFQGAIWGDNKLRVSQPANVTSFFNVCQGFFFQYMTFYVNEVGTVGTYANVVEWISDDEYEYLKRQGY